MSDGVPFRWKAYGGLVAAASWLHYAVLSRFGRSDEGGAVWYDKRLSPVLPQPAHARRIWIHAVSAGESKVAELLRHRLLERDPTLSVVLSATTYSGHARVRAIAGDASSFIMPLDTLEAQRRVFAAVKPDLLVLVESEFWPAQFAAAGEAGVPVVVVNATMSERSFARHRRWPQIARRTICRAARIFAQDETIAARYAALGVPRERLEIAGNLKLVPPAQLPPTAKPGSPLVAFGNVHRDEIDDLAAAVAVLRAQRADARVVLVPRYPGKIPGEMLVARFGAELAMIESEAALDGAGPLVWLDEMGTLARVYGRATLGVVCGTFSPIGGHDLAEPLQLGAASVYGPHVERQKALHAALSAAGCAVQVASAAELPGALVRLLDRPAEREAQVQQFAALSRAAAAGAEAVTVQLAALAQGGLKPSA